MTNPVSTPYFRMYDLMVSLCRLALTTHRAARDAPNMHVLTDDLALRPDKQAAARVNPRRMLVEAVDINPALLHELYEGVVAYLTALRDELSARGVTEHPALQQLLQQLVDQRVSIRTFLMSPNFARSLQSVLEDASVRSVVDTVEMRLRSAINALYTRLETASSVSTTDDQRVFRLSGTLFVNGRQSGNFSVAATHHHLVEIDGSQQELTTAERLELYSRTQELLQEMERARTRSFQQGMRAVRSVQRAPMEEALGEQALERRRGMLASMLASEQYASAVSRFLESVGGAVPEGVTREQVERVAYLSVAEQFGSLLRGAELADPDWQLRLSPEWLSQLDEVQSLLQIPSVEGLAAVYRAMRSLAYATVSNAPVPQEPLPELLAQAMSETGSQLELTTSAREYLGEVYRHVVENPQVYLNLRFSAAPDYGRLLEEIVSTPYHPLLVYRTMLGLQDEGYIPELLNRLREMEGVSVEPTEQMRFMASLIRTLRGVYQSIVVGSAQPEAPLGAQLEVQPSIQPEAASPSESLAFAQSISPRVLELWNEAPGFENVIHEVPELLRAQAEQHGVEAVEAAARRVGEPLLTELAVRRLILARMLGVDEPELSPSEMEQLASRLRFLHELAGEDEELMRATLALDAALLRVMTVKDALNESIYRGSQEESDAALAEMEEFIESVLRQYGVREWKREVGDIASVISGFLDSPDSLFSIWDMAPDELIAHIRTSPINPLVMAHNLLYGSVVEEAVDQFVQRYEEMVSTQQPESVVPPTDTHPVSIEVGSVQPEVVVTPSDTPSVSVEVDSEQSDLPPPPQPMTPQQVQAMMAYILRHHTGLDERGMSALYENLRYFAEELGLSEEDLSFLRSMMVRDEGAHAGGEPYTGTAVLLFSPRHNLPYETDIPVKPYTFVVDVHTIHAIPIEVEGMRLEPWIDPSLFGDVLHPVGELAASEVVRQAFREIAAGRPVLVRSEEFVEALYRMISAQLTTHVFDSPSQVGLEQLERLFGGGDYTWDDTDPYSIDLSERLARQRLMEIVDAVTIRRRVGRTGSLREVELRGTGRTMPHVTPQQLLELRSEEAARRAAAVERAAEILETRGEYIAATRGGELVRVTGVEEGEPRLRVRPLTLEEFLSQVTGSEAPLSPAPYSQLESFLSDQGDAHLSFSFTVEGSVRSDIPPALMDVYGTMARSARVLGAVVGDEALKRMHWRFGASIAELLGRREGSLEALRQTFLEARQILLDRLTDEPTDIDGDVDYDDIYRHLTMLRRAKSDEEAARAFSAALDDLVGFYQEIRSIVSEVVSVPESETPLLDQRSIERISDRFLRALLLEEDDSRRAAQRLWRSFVASASYHQMARHGLLERLTESFLEGHLESFVSQDQLDFVGLGARFAGFVGFTPASAQDWQLLYSYLYYRLHQRGVEVDLPENVFGALTGFVNRSVLVESFQTPEGGASPQDAPTPTEEPNVAPPQEPTPRYWVGHEEMLQELGLSRPDAPPVTGQAGYETYLELRGRQRRRFATIFGWGDELEAQREALSRLQEQFREAFESLSGSEQERHYLVALASELARRTSEAMYVEERMERSAYNPAHFPVARALYNLIYLADDDRSRLVVALKRTYLGSVSARASDVEALQELGAAAFAFAAEFVRTTPPGSRIRELGGEIMPSDPDEVAEFLRRNLLRLMIAHALRRTGAEDVLGELRTVSLEQSLGGGDDDRPSLVELVQDRDVAAQMAAVLGDEKETVKWSASHRWEGEQSRIRYQQLRVIEGIGERYEQIDPTGFLRGIAALLEREPTAGQAGQGHGVPAQQVPPEQQGAPPDVAAEGATSPTETMAPSERDEGIAYLARLLREQAKVRVQGGGIATTLYKAINNLKSSQEALEKEIQKVKKQIEELQSQQSQEQQNQHGQEQQNQADGSQVNPEALRQLEYLERIASRPAGLRALAIGISAATGWRISPEKVEQQLKRWKDPGLPPPGYSSTLTHEARMEAQANLHAPDDERRGPTRWRDVYAKRYAPEESLEDVLRWYLGDEAYEALLRELQNEVPASAREKVPDFAPKLSTVLPPEPPQPPSHEGKARAPRVVQRQEVTVRLDPEPYDRHVIQMTAEVFPGAERSVTPEKVHQYSIMHLRDISDVLTDLESGSISVEDAVSVLGRLPVQTAGRPSVQLRMYVGDTPIELQVLPGRRVSIGGRVLSLDEPEEYSVLPESIVHIPQQMVSPIRPDEPSIPLEVRLVQAPGGHSIPILSVPPDSGAVTGVAVGTPHFSLDIETDVRTGQLLQAGLVSYRYSPTGDLEDESYRLWITSSALQSPEALADARRQLELLVSRTMERYSDPQDVARELASALGTDESVILPYLQRSSLPSELAAMMLPQAPLAPQDERHLVELLRSYPVVQTERAALRSVAEELLRRTGETMVVQNIGFDVPTIARRLEEYGDVELAQRLRTTFGVGRAVDVAELAARAGFAEVSLQALARRVGLLPQFGREAHLSLEDAILAAQTAYPLQRMQMPSEPIQPGTYLLGLGPGQLYAGELGEPVIGLRDRVFRVEDATYSLEQGRISLRLSELGFDEQGQPVVLRTLRFEPAMPGMEQNPLWHATLEMARMFTPVDEETARRVYHEDIQDRVRREIERVLSPDLPPNMTAQPGMEPSPYEREGILSTMTTLLRARVVAEGAPQDVSADRLVEWAQETLGLQGDVGLPPELLLERAQIAISYLSNVHYQDPRRREVYSRLWEWWVSEGRREELGGWLSRVLAYGVENQMSWGAMTDMWRYITAHLIEQAGLPTISPFVAPHEQRVYNLALIGARGQPLTISVPAGLPDVSAESMVLHRVRTQLRQQLLESRHAQELGYSPRFEVGLLAQALSTGDTGVVRRTLEGLMLRRQAALLYPVDAERAMEMFQRSEQELQQLLGDEAVVSARTLMELSPHQFGAELGRNRLVREALDEYILRVALPVDTAAVNAPDDWIRVLEGYDVAAENRLNALLGLAQAVERDAQRVAVEQLVPPTVEDVDELMQRAARHARASGEARRAQSLLEQMMGELRQAGYRVSANDILYGVPIHAAATALHQALTEFAQVGEADIGQVTARMRELLGTDVIPLGRYNELRLDVPTAAHEFVQFLMRAPGWIRRYTDAVDEEWLQWVYEQTYRMHGRQVLAFYRNRNQAVQVEQPPVTPFPEEYMQFAMETFSRMYGTSEPVQSAPPPTEEGAAPPPPPPPSGPPPVPSEPAPRPPEPPPAQAPRTTPPPSSTVYSPSHGPTGLSLVDLVVPSMLVAGLAAGSYLLYRMFRRRSEDDEARAAEQGESRGRRGTGIVGSNRFVIQANPYLLQPGHHIRFDSDYRKPSPHRLRRMESDMEGLL